MSLNIKNARVHHLAKRAAEITGMSMTGAIEEALERLLRDYGQDGAELQVAARMDLVHKLVVAYADDPGVSNPEIAAVEDLFDEAGMPR
ncbi:MAG: type II toxin-antitoxin system VapB family antitoxin [Propionibacteriaceae bacterium]|nr:type II toxin-antitoxin system VapB family antitoxin [Propionibacteriaceae bacterium]